MCTLTTVLDPQFKLKGFLSASSAAHARMLLITECEVYLNSLAAQNDLPQPKRSRKEQQAGSTLWNLFDEMLADSENGNEGNKMFLKQPVLPYSKHTHPLEYWKQKNPLWPCLAYLACKYLAIPPSSVAS